MMPVGEADAVGDMTSVCGIDGIDRLITQRTILCRLLTGGGIGKRTGIGWIREADGCT